MKEKIDSFGADYQREVLPVIFRYPQTHDAYGVSMALLLLRYYQEGRVEEIEEFLTFLQSGNLEDEFKGFSLDKITDNVQRTYDNLGIGFKMTPQKLAEHICHEVEQVATDRLCMTPLSLLDVRVFGVKQKDRLAVILEDLDSLSPARLAEFIARLEKLKKMVWRDPKLDELASMWKTPESRNIFRSQDDEFDRFQIQICYGMPFAERINELIKESLGTN